MPAWIVIPVMVQEPVKMNKEVWLIRNSAYKKPASHKGVVKFIHRFFSELWPATHELIINRELKYI